MLGMHNRTVNVDRLQLLEALQKNLAIHTQDYAEAIVGWKEKVAQDLQAAADKVSNTSAEQLNNIDLHFDAYPTSYADQYTEVIEMLEMSVDPTIQLDSQSFKAYVKNEWSWSRGFLESTTMYKTFAAGASLK